MMIRYKWNDGKFTHAPKGHFNALANQRKLMDEIAKDLNITDLEGWYQIPTNELKKLGVSKLLRRHNGSPLKLFQSLYPEYLKCAP